MSTSSSFTNSHSAGASFLNAHDEVPYDADEIAEDCRWHELQSNGTPYKDDLRGTLPGNLETTPAAKTNEFINTEISPVKITRLGNEEDAWPWRRENVVDTWNSLLNTPQRPESLPNSALLGSSQPDAPHSYLQSIHQTTASAWSTDQEDNDHEDVDPNLTSSQFHHHSQHQHHPQSHHQHTGSFGSFNPTGMARLSLSEESEMYGNPNAMSHQQQQLSQQLQGRPRQPHMMSQQQQQQQQMSQPSYINNPQQQQGYSHPTHQYAQQQQLQQQQQQQPQQMRSGMHSEYMQQGHLMHQQQQQQQSQQQQGVRYPSPPPSSQSTSGPVNVRSIVSQPPGHAWMNSGSASAQMAIPAPVLRSNQFQSSSTFAHSTSGPVRGMPTNQVNYNQQHPIHQQQQQGTSQMYPRGQGAHSQPLTPVGSFVNSSAPGNYQSHSHPASPRGAQSHAGDPHTTSTLSSFVGTPNLSPLSSPIISPHASPSRYNANKQQTQSQQQSTQSFAPQQQQQQPTQQQHPHMNIMGMHMRSNSSNVSSLSSSGASTPTSQVGPPFHAQAQAVFNYQQSNMMMQQQSQQQQVQQVQVQVSQNYGPPPSYHSMSAASNANMGSNMSMMQQPYVQQNMQNPQGMNPQSSPQRRPLVIQTGSQMMQGHYVSVPQQQHMNMPHPMNQQGGTLLIKPNMPSIANVHPNASTTPTNSQAPVLSGDSPTSKSRFKIFYRDLWALVRETDSVGGSVGAEKAYEYGLGALKQPEHERIAWKIAMELADLAKRQNHIPRARFWYQRAHTLEPLASQVWIEHAKMEEECGELLECERLMEEGLKHCEGNEALMIKALKHHERMGDLVAARSILAKLKDSPLDKVWRTVLEGGLMEARMGQMTVARRVFKYLLSHVNWMGPIYSEYARVEERWAHFDAALAVVEKGLVQVPRYGPLWFMAFRLHERTCNGDYDVARLHAQRALSHVSTELVWKMHFELAQMEERLGEFERARDSYAASIHHCPMNLRWKIWLSGARMELLSGDPARIPVVRALLNRANDEVPRKMKCMVSLELSRMEEFLGNLNEARRILKVAQKESKGEWKVFLESVLLELRAGNIDAAIAEAESALEIHNGTGRLWAILIQLKQKQKHALGHRIGHTNGSMKSQWAIFKLAIREVPKSGEVWCEGARLVLNPYAPRYFNLKAAKRFLNFAIQFTPQYGDSFIEYLRLKMILEGITEMSTQLPGSSAPAQQPSQLYTAANAAANAGTEGAANQPLTFQGSGRSTPTDSSLSASNQSHFRRVQQLCVNAEPNYGSSWFACKPHPLWSPVEVLDVARGMIETHLIKNQSQYQTAILRNWYAEQTAGSRSPSVHEMEIENLHPAEAGEIAPFSPQVLQRMRTHSRSSSIRSASDESVPEQLEFAPLSPSLSSRMSEASIEAETTVAASSTDMEEVTNTVTSLASLQVDAQAENVASALAAQQFSPTTLRLARDVENGRCMVLDNDSHPCSSRSTTPDSMSSQLLTSEDDEDDLQAEYQADAEFNSLQILYPPIANLSVADKHRCLYGADPITP